MKLGGTERVWGKEALEKPPEKSRERPRDKPKYFCDPDEKMQKLDASIKQRDKLAQELVAVRSDLAGIRRSLGLCFFFFLINKVLYICFRDIFIPVHRFL